MFFIPYVASLTLFFYLVGNTIAIISWPRHLEGSLMGILILTLLVLLVLSGMTFFLDAQKFQKSFDFLTSQLTPLLLLLPLWPIFQVLLGADPLTWIFPWSLFQGHLSLKLDALSAFFLFPILLISFTACIFGRKYLRQHLPAKNLGKIWAATLLLIFSLICVVLANNIVLFLLVWETMSLSSFFLVIYQAESESSRKAGWLYLSLTQIGTVFIIAFFLLLSKNATSLDFSSLSAQGFSPQLSALCFFFALIGFGTKAGIMPLHIWLPEAHPKAPSHISALMSGVMIKTGIYGILRALTLIGTVQPSWGITLLIVGALTGIVSVIFAIAQKDIKRLLAYCSVKNIGIILLGLGLGLLGLSHDNALLALMGFAGALLHVLNHAIFKGLLFLSAGSVISSTHTQDMEEMGGLGKQMPITGGCFLIGSISICSLPPFNGFISEFLIYLGSFQALRTEQSWNNLPYILTILSLSLIGGLAVLCFTKAYGVIFLGAPRTKLSVEPKENNWEMTAPQILLSALCLLIGLLPFWAFALVKEPLKILTLGRIELPSLDGMIQILSMISLGAFIFLGLLALLTFLRRSAVQKRSYHESETWGCGYTKPTARIQYTGSSFVQMLSDHFDFVLKGKRKRPIIDGLFPKKDNFQSEFADSLSEGIFKPAFHAIKKGLNRLIALQHGLLNVYVLYIVITLVLLLFFQLD